MVRDKLAGYTDRAAMSGHVLDGFHVEYDDGQAARCRIVYVGFSHEFTISLCRTPRSNRFLFSVFTGLAQWAEVDVVVWLAVLREAWPGRATISTRDPGADLDPWPGRLPWPCVGPAGAPGRPGGSEEEGGGASTKILFFGSIVMLGTGWASS